MTQSTLEDRILNLEAQVRRMRFAFCTIAILGPLGFLAMAPAAPAPKRIVADEFVVGGEDGKEFIKISPVGIFINNPLLKKQQMVLASWGTFVCNESGQRLASLFATSDGGSITVCDKNGNDNINIRCMEVNGKTSSLISVHSNKRTQAGDVKSEIAIDVTEEQPSIFIRDDQSRDRVILGCSSLISPKTGSVENRPPSSLVLFDRDGKAIFQTP